MAYTIYFGTHATLKGQIDRCRDSQWLAVRTGNVARQVELEAEYDRLTALVSEPD